MMTHPPVRPFEVDPAEYPFESHWFERDGSWIHYVDEGEGVPVILLHGNPTWSFLYRNVIKELDGACRAIAVDYPGFGFSQHPPDYGYTPQEHAQWVNALIDHLALDRFVIFGQDWGGPIGLDIGVNRPDDVAGLVLGNTFGWRADGIMRIFSAIMGGAIGRYLILRHNFFARRLMPMLLTRPESKAPAILKAYTDPFPTPESRMGTYVFPWALRGTGDWMMAIQARTHLLASKPVELVFGKRDAGLGSESVIGRWHTIFPDAAFDRIPDAGHYFQEERPDRAATAVSRVLDALEG